MKDIMLDLETLSLANNAVVVSIGAVKFDLATGKTGETFNVRLNILEQAVNGGDISTSTLQWWSQQDSEAKAKLCTTDIHSVTEALTLFNRWASTNEDISQVDVKNIRMWGNGVGFDNVILRNLFTRHNIKCVLPYWCDTDVRTLTQLEDYDKVKELTGEFTGTKHDALDDCYNQIKMCHIAYKLIKGEK